MGVDDGIDVRVVAKHRPRYWYHRRVRPRGARRATGLGNDLTRFYRIELEVRPVWKSKFYGAFVLNQRVVLHAIDATPARWRGDAGSSPLDGARTAASSPRNDLVKNCAPDSLVEFHTGYHEMTTPLLDHYKAVVKEVDAAKAPAEIGPQIDELVAPYKK